MSAPVVAVAGLATGLPPGAAPGPLRAYLRAVRAAGGEPAVARSTADRVLAGARALLLPGGGDVDPRRYGQTPGPRLERVDPERDAAETELCQRALAMGLPLLAICRGAQVLNVALGGTLVQHLPEGSHRRRAGAGLLHPVRAREGSRIAGACGRAFAAWSSHHQALDRLGGGMAATAWAPDGVVEGAELAEGWVVAVQWHPERTAACDPAQAALFRALVEAARA